MDISGAFNEIWQHFILYKLKSYSCPNNLLNLVESFLHNRQISLNVGTASASKFTSRGCPQGASLSPLLWNIAISEIFSIPLPLNYQILAFADDITIICGSRQIKHIHNKPEKIIQE